MTWNLGLGMWPKPKIFYCHRSRYTYGSLCVKLLFYIWPKTKTLSYMGSLNKMTLSYLGFQGVVTLL
jgi:hypothetical protein